MYLIKKAIKYVKFCLAELYSLIVIEPKVLFEIR